MYYLAKIAQATGLTIVLIGFLAKFPDLMNTKVLTSGVILFGFGWFIQKFMLKK